MSQEISPSYDLTTSYVPVALYFQESDFVEYVREDACCVYKRIDETLTLALEMDTRLPIGFRIKGFKNLYLKTVKPKDDGGAVFVELMSLIEQIALEAGNKFFPDHKRAYKVAADIARSDDVRLDIEDIAA